MLTSGRQIFIQARSFVGLHRRTLAMAPTETSIASVATAPAVKPLRLLFCGDEQQFPDSVKYSKDWLREHPHIQVDILPIPNVAHNIQHYDMCVPRMMKLDAEVISRAQKMKLICQFGVGLEGVDVEAATNAGIKVGRIPGHNTGNALSCAEHAIYLILALLRDQRGMEDAVSSKRLGQPAGLTLYGRTVFIVGYGNIGRELAARLRAFGVRILASKRAWSKKTSSQSSGGGISPCSFQHCTGEELVDEKGDRSCLHEFASRADIIVLCCVQTPETAGMVNAKFVEAMKKGAFLVNVARGGLLDYEAVKHGVESGKIGGLGIDVAWHEPYDPNDPILQHPNVIITPHVAGVTDLSYKAMGKVIADSAVELSRGQQSFPGVELVN